MPSDWPSRTGNGVAPKSSTMWWVSLSVPSSVTRWLPATVAVAGLRCAYRWTYGCAADQGGTCEPGTRSAPTGAAAGASTPSAARAPASTASGTARLGAFSDGSSSQVSCSPVEYASMRSIVRQLSIEPVGHGGTQAKHRLHLSASTT